MEGLKGYCKRLFDLSMALVCLILLSPIILVIAIAIVLDSGFPVLFVQWRAGREGRQFLIYKFRTMYLNSTGGEYIIRGDYDRRITRIGRVLRKFSLDELPQLYNVLKGEMSIVGPRPTLPYQVERYDCRQKKRLNAKPGITGWAQVNGRNQLSWREKIDLDLWYIENHSLLLDLKIMLKTFFVVFQRQGLYASSLQDDISASEKVIIIGAGGHGRVVADILLQARKEATILGFLDDNPTEWNKQITGLPVLGGISRVTELCSKYSTLSAVVAVGDNNTRKRIVAGLQGKQLNFINAVHPKAVIGKDIIMGVGVMMMAGSVINTGATIGSHSIINTSSTVDHDCKIGDFAHISPGANLGGAVEIGEAAHVGIGVAVLPGKHIGSGAVIGAGAVVVEDIPENVVAAGVPARVIRKKTIELMT